MISPMLIGVLVAAFLVGAVPALVKVLKPRLQQALQLDQDRVDRLERMQFFLAWVAGMPLAGYLADVWSRNDVLAIGGIGIACTLAFFGVTESHRWLGAMSFLLGLATSFLAVGTLVLIAQPDTIPYAHCPAAALNAGFVAIGLGSFCPQIIFPSLERWLGYRRALLILGLGALIPVAFLFAAVVSQPSDAPVPPSMPPLSWDFLNNPRFWLIAAMLLLYYPIESALDFWAEPFLGEIGYQQRLRTMLFGFWTMFFLARLAMWFWLGPRDEIWLLAICVAVSAVVLGNLVGAYGASAGGLGFWLVGACYGPLLPGFLGLLAEYFPMAPDDARARALPLGCVLALAGLHDALAQPIMQRAAQGRSVRVAMRVPLVVTLLMLIPLVIFGLVKTIR